MGKQLYFDQRSQLETIKPDDKFGQYSLFWRKGREDFLGFFMGQKQAYFDVGIWSSCDRDKTAAFSRSFFGKHFRNLLFVSTVNREQYDGPATEYSPEPIPITRDLGQIKNKFPQYDLNNIIMISPYQNISELHRYNDLIIQKYCPTIVNFEEDQTLLSLIKYVNGISLLLNKDYIQDVRTALRSKSFKNLDGRVMNSQQQYKEYL